MSVYVDPLFKHGGSRTFHWEESCHMYADTLDELHAMAQAIGMKRAWFQFRRDLPHYDLVPARRREAIKRGAIEHTRKQLVEFMRENRFAAVPAATLQQNGITQKEIFWGTVVVGLAKLYVDMLKKDAK